MKLKTFLMAMALALLVPATSYAQDMGIDLGVQAPAAALTTLDGKAANLSQHIGKGPVVMYFWATWCPVCKELTPALTAVASRYAGKATFINVAVSVNQSPALAQRYVNAHKMGGVQYYDAKGEATGAYDVPATSYVVVVDRAGKIVYTGVGGDQAPKIEAALKKVLP